MSTLTYSNFRDIFKVTHFKNSYGKLLLKASNYAQYILKYNSYIKTRNSKVAKLNPDLFPLFCAISKMLYKSLKALYNVLFLRWKAVWNQFKISDALKMPQLGLSLFPWYSLILAHCSQYFSSNLEEEYECSLAFFNFHKLNIECIES